MRHIISAGTRHVACRSIPLFAAILLAAGAVPATAQVAGVDLDTVRMGQFDYGKMWTFEHAPSEYFTDTYGFAADAAWFEAARLSVLRVPGCSASFVSATGLVATNHHCVRGRVEAITRDGEALLDNGFWAKSLEEERPIPGYYADQLVATLDISDEVFAATDRARNDEERQAAREAVLEEIVGRLRQEHLSPGDSIWVQTKALYNGGRYSAYVFRRFTDVRMVAAAELQAGFFGGDPDNFTYPRYALDFALLRVYEDGEPFHPDHFFEMNSEGVSEGDAVFIIGNPGQTNRLKTMAQIEYQGAISIPAFVNFLDTRLDAMAEYRREHPADAAEIGIRNQMFGLSNSLKAGIGRMEALEDPVILAKKADAERVLKEAIAADPVLGARYAELFEQIAEIQREKARYGAESGAFTAFGNSRYGSQTLRRGLMAHNYLEAKANGSSEAELAEMRNDLEEVQDLPRELELLFTEARLTDFQRFLGDDSEVTQTALRGTDVASAASTLLEVSTLSSAEGTKAALDSDALSPNDPAVQIAAAMAPSFREFREAMGRLNAREEILEEGLGRAQFAVYGTSIPPDGSFSPRIADGVVKGYEYNGTIAPPFTTFYGMYDRYVAHGRGEGAGEEWALPARYQTPPEGLDLATPLNFVSTTDSYGGNSGSPAVTPDLELVGLNFDRNINGLSRDFIYLPEQGRNVMVDVRAILATLDVVYDMDRILAELATGRLYETEAAADAATD